MIYEKVMVRKCYTLIQYEDGTICGEGNRSKVIGSLPKKIKDHYSQITQIELETPVKGEEGKLWITQFNSLKMDGEPERYPLEQVFITIDKRTIGFLKGLVSKLK